MQSDRITVVCLNCGAEFAVTAPRLASGRGKYCSPACRAQHVAARRIRPIADRVREKIDENGPIPPHRPELGPCSVWTGGVSRAGYGRLVVSRGGKKRFLIVSRVVWELANGPIPDGLHVLHHCDNPPCVRLSHLWLGTDGDNMRDCAAKGRTSGQAHPETAARGERHGSRTKPDRVPRGERHGSRTKPESIRRGESHGMAKFTEADIRDIRARADGETRTALAREYGVEVGTISAIVLRRLWKHVE